MSYKNCKSIRKKADKALTTYAFFMNGCYLLN